MIIIPSKTTKKINQNNRSKILGDFWSSFGIDLQSNLGTIRVSPRLMINTSGVANQGLSTAFSTFNARVYTLADTRIFNNTPTNGMIDATTPFTEDVSTGAITTYSKDTGDLETFNSELCATAQTKLMSLNTTTSTWTQRATLTTGSLHKMLWFLKTNRLYYFEAFSTIHSLDTSWSEATPGSSYAIDLINAGYKLGGPYTMDTDGQDIWIGMTQNNSNVSSNQYTGSYILRWDGISSTVTSVYKVKARGILAMCKDDRNIMHAIDTNGALLQFTGSGFEEIGRLPLNKSLLTNACTTLYNAFVHPNGFKFTRNGTFIVAVNNLVEDNAGSIKENLASGIWEFSKDTGFVHRNSFTYTPVGSTTITDYGQNRISRIGALMETDLSSTSANGNPQLLCGATLYTDASSTTNAILIDDPLNTTTKYGNFVTSWFLASGLKDNWNKFALRYRQLLNSVDRIWLKYRTTEVTATEINLTWISSTSFTTTTNLVAMVGYEIEVIQGTGSGKCAHIISVGVTGGIYTIVLDEPFVGVTTGTAKARVQAWIKFLTVNDQFSESILKQLGKNSERIQVKCCMQFTGDDELFELIIINNTNQPLVP